MMRFANEIKSVLFELSLWRAARLFSAGLQPCNPKSPSPFPQSWPPFRRALSVLRVGLIPVQKHSTTFSLSTVFIPVPRVAFFALTKDHTEAKRRETRDSLINVLFSKLTSYKFDFCFLIWNILLLNEFSIVSIEFILWNGETSWGHTSFWRVWDSPISCQASRIQKCHKQKHNSGRFFFSQKKPR